MSKKNTILALFLFLLVTSSCVSTHSVLETSPSSTVSPLSKAASSEVLSTPTATFVSEQLESRFLFVYSTYQGGIYQAGLSSKKQQLISPDGMRKRDLKWSPDQFYLAYIAVELTETGLIETFWVFNVNEGTSHLLFGPAKALRYSWSGDQTLYLEEAISIGRIPFGEDTVIQAHRIDLRNDKIQTTKRRTELYLPPKVSPDGTMSIWNEQINGKWVLYLLDDQENKLAEIYQDASGELATGSWAPDSQHLAIFRPDEEEIYLYEIETREWIQLSSFTNYQAYRVTNLEWSPDGNWLSYTFNSREKVNQICVFAIQEKSEQCFNTRWISSDYAWSRDSRFIGYLAKTASEEIDIFVVDVHKDKIINLTQDGGELIENWIAKWF